MIGQRVGHRGRAERDRVGAAADPVRPGENPVAASVSAATGRVAHETGGRGVGPAARLARAVLIGLVAAGFSAPVTARWFDPAKGATDPPAGTLPNKSGRTVRTPGDNGTGANDGVLAPDARPPRPALNVLCIGDSNTENWDPAKMPWVKEAHTGWPDNLTKLLADKGHAGSRVTTWAIGGTTTEYWATLDAAKFRKDLRALGPNVVVVMLGTNDGQRSKTSADLEASQTALLSRLRDALPNAALLTVSCYSMMEHDDRGANYVFDGPYLRAAAPARAGYWDFYWQFQFAGENKTAGYDNKEWGDGLHMTNRGEQVAARLLYPQILRTLDGTLVPDPRNLLLDPGFESGGPGPWAAPRPEGRWNRKAQFGEQVKAAPQDPRSGLYAARFMAGNGRLAQTVPRLDPDTEYLYSGYVKRDAGRKAVAGVTAPDGTGIQSAEVAGTGAYAPFAVRFKSGADPAACRGLRFVVGKAGDGDPGTDMVVDDVALMKWDAIGPFDGFRHLRPKGGTSGRHRVPPPTGEFEVRRKATTAAAVAVKGAEVMEARTFTEPGTGDAMPYRLFKLSNPEPGKTYPLVLLLHHATRGGDDNLRHVRDDAGVGAFCHPDAQAKHPCYVLAPQAGGKNRPEAWADVPCTEPAPPWPPEPNRNMRLALGTLDAVVKEFPVDPARVYVSGASMGSYGAHDAITRRPGFFAAAVTICGGYTPAGAPRLLDTPIWTLHGDADETIDVDRSRTLFDAVKAAGGKQMTYWEYPGVRHSFARDLAYADPAVLDWLFRQRRN